MTQTSQFPILMKNVVKKSTSPLRATSQKSQKNPRDLRVMNQIVVQMIRTSAIQYKLFYLNVLVVG